jgi:hypothetical protein
MVTGITMFITILNSEAKPVFSYSLFQGKVFPEIIGIPAAILSNPLFREGLTTH